MNTTSPLPTDAKARKNIPLFSGCLKYFPDALMAVASCSKAGNDQHNPGTALHWDRSKSGDELDALMRHLVDAGTMDADGIRHSAKVAWRALANLQKEIEQDREEPPIAPVRYVVSGEEDFHRCYLVETRHGDDYSLVIYEPDGPTDLSDSYTYGETQQAIQSGVWAVVSKEEAEARIS